MESAKIFFVHMYGYIKRIYSLNKSTLVPGIYMWKILLEKEIIILITELVNFLWQRLEEMEVQNIPLEQGQKQFDVVNKGDVVVLPAFGAAVEEMWTLSDRSVQIVDTTCPWVSKVCPVVSRIEHLSDLDVSSLCFFCPSPVVFSIKCLYFLIEGLECS